MKLDLIFNGCTVFHLTGIQRFIQPLHNWLIFRLFPVFSFKKQATVNAFREGNENSTSFWWGVASSSSLSTLLIQLAIQTGRVHYFVLCPVLTVRTPGMSCIQLFPIKYQNTSEIFFLHSNRCLNHLNGNTSWKSYPEKLPSGYSLMVSSTGLTDRRPKESTENWKCLFFIRKVKAVLQAKSQVANM